MTISIAMASYNGARHIREQLESFSAQTRWPDELVVTDDGSTDETLALMEDFAQIAPFSVRLYRNNERLGFARNFERALSLCKGDIIFLSDQDDIWSATKVDSHLSIYTRAENAQVVINDQEIADSNMRPTGVTKLGNIRRGRLPISQFITGCCSSMRRSWREFSMPIPSSSPAHDIWINGLAHRLGVLHVLDQSLQLYRRHENNASDWENSRAHPRPTWRRMGEIISTSVKSDIQKSIDFRTAVHDRLEHGRTTHFELAPRENWNTAIDAIFRDLTFLTERADLRTLPRRQRGLRIASLLLRGEYRRGNGLLSALRDLGGNVC